MYIFFLSYWGMGMGGAGLCELEAESGFPSREKLDAGEGV